jgi:hypothetical protein
MLCNMSFENAFNNSLYKRICDKILNEPCRMHAYETKFS